MSISDNLPDPEPTPVGFNRTDDSKTMPHAVAAEMLTAWRERNPGQWGYWFAAATTGVEPAKGGRKPKPETH